MRIFSCFARVWALGGMVSILSAASPTASQPDFAEVRALILTNVPGVTATEIDRHAVTGLLEGFRGKVRLVEDQSGRAADGTNISKAIVLDRGIAYLRVGEVSAKLSEELARDCRALALTNRLKGVVLDFRFADGEDYAAAAATVDLFVTDDRDLLDWGNGMVRSSAKTNALSWPVVALVNGETAGASEALAALLRDTGVAVILGNPTVGAAMTSEEFPLSNGQRLRITTKPVVFAGGLTVPGSGLNPDIQVPVAPDEERKYWNDPYGLRTNSLAAANGQVSTNRIVRRIRTTEADLVRARREGLDLDGDIPRQREPEAEPPVIRDPALGRAVDLLKGLAVVRRQP